MNLLLIHSDQHRYDCLGANGHPFLQTPNLDRLAREGLRFTHAFTPVPLCTPARNCLLHGCWPHQHLAICNYDTEAPRGDDMHWSMLGDNQKLFRWRCRAPTYANWPALRYMLRGNTIADAPLIVASIDPCYSCCDRMTLIDVNKRKSTTVSYQEMERYCRERTASPLR